MVNLENLWDAVIIQHVGIPEKYDYDSLFGVDCAVLKEKVNQIALMELSSYMLVKGANLYTNSIYKELFDDVSVPFITLDEVTNKILEKEEKVGAMAPIKDGG